MIPRRNGRTFRKETTFTIQRLFSVSFVGMEYLNIKCLNPPLSTLRLNEGIMMSLGWLNHSSPLRAYSCFPGSQLSER
jgi:hypothetical protein